MTQRVSEPLRYEGEAVKGSRFIVDIAPAADEALARRALAKAVADFPDASHHCWAWRIASPAIDRAGDDGEPTGSAGRPILAQLLGRDLVDTAAIVTRYFGGTKLGVGGLMRAYGGAAGEALDTMTFTAWVALVDVSFEHDYSLTDAVERLMDEAGGTIISRDFGTAVRQHISLPVDAFVGFAAAVADMTAGAVLLAAEPATQDDPADEPTSSQ